MKQSRSISLIKSVVSTAVGFGISLVAQWIFLPLLGVEIALHQNITFAIIMTVISVARGYAMERVFEFLGMRVRIPASILAIAAERQRQQSIEGWTPDHDDDHARGDLARAGACYALAVAARALRDSGADAVAVHIESIIDQLWPWAREWWKPGDNRRDLVRSGALTVAELDKMDRARKQKRAA